MLKNMTVRLCGWGAGFATVLMFYDLAPAASTVLVTVAFFAAGFGIGVCAGCVPWIVLRPRAFASAAFVGVLTAALPVVFATYGFALIGLPVVVLWSVIVCLGIRSVPRICGRAVPTA